MSGDGCYVNIMTPGPARYTRQDVILSSGTLLTVVLFICLFTLTFSAGKKIFNINLERRHNTISKTLLEGRLEGTGKRGRHDIDGWTTLRDGQEPARPCVVGRQEAEQTGDSLRSAFHVEAAQDNDEDDCG